ncbi:MAG: hypothetical protein DRN30_05305, partial [Thermoplasmata archaeon]
MGLKLSRKLCKLIVMGSYFSVLALIVREVLIVQKQGNIGLPLYYAIVGLGIMSIMAVLQVILLDAKAKSKRVSDKLLVLESITYALILFIIGIILLIPIGVIRGSVNVGHTYAIGVIATSMALIIVLALLMVENKKQIAIEKLYLKIEKIAMKKFESSREMIIIDEGNMYVPEVIAKELSLGISGIVPKRWLVMELSHFEKDLGDLIDGKRHVAIIKKNGKKFVLIRSENTIEVLPSENVVGIARLDENGKILETCGENFVDTILDIWMNTMAQEENSENIVEYRGKIYIIRRKDSKT